jgi:hypothetical protein
VTSEEYFIERHKIGFYTATIYQWKSILGSDKYKEIIIDRLKFLVENRRAKIYGFVYR